jgi:hypothetical protein
MVRRRHLPRVARADLAAAARDAARERQDRALHRPHRGGRRLRRAQCRRHVLGQDDDVAAADALDDPEALLDEELALHHRNAPVAASVEHLARLPAVTEVAQLAPHVGLLLGVQAVEAGSRRARQHGHADALDEPLAQPFRVGGEQQHGDARAAVGGLRRVELALDPRLALAPDHRRGEARQRARRVLRPAGRVGGDHYPRAPHRERLGERVLDPGVVEPHQVVASALTRRAGSSSHGSVTG